MNCCDCANEYNPYSDSCDCDCHQKAYEALLAETEEREREHDEWMREQGELAFYQTPRERLM